MVMAAAEAAAIKPTPTTTADLPQTATPERVFSKPFPQTASFSLDPRNEWCTMRLSPARAPLNAQSLHPNSVAMMASGSSARIALSRFWLVLGLLWLVASVVWFSGQMVDRTCAARTGRARKTLRGPAVGSTRPLSKQVVPLPAEMPVLLDDDAKVHPTWQRARFGPQPRLPGRHPTPRRRRRGVTMFFFFSLPRPPEPSNAGEQDPTCNAARRAKATDGTSMN